MTCEYTYSSEYATVKTALKNKASRLET